MPGLLKNRNILLIEPPFYRLFKETYALVRLPLSLAYLAGALCARTEWDVRVYNSDFRLPHEPFEISHFTGPGFQRYLDRLNDTRAGVWEEIRSEVRIFSPAVVGLTIKSPMLASARNTARLVKEIDPETRVIAGGPHASLDWRSVLECPDIDIGVLGEGEETIVELMAALENRTELSEVKGLAFRKHGEPVRTPPREPVTDLDRLVSPHEFAPRILKDYDRYPPSALGRVMAVRGCPFNCRFCGSRALWGRKARSRSPENVVAELLDLWSKGIDVVHFEDDSFGVHPENLRDLTRLIASKVPGLTWSCETHVNLITDEKLARMKEAGCRAIQVGIESGSNHVLDTMRKGFTLEKALEACERIKRHGFRLETFFMAGFPTETESTLRETLTAIKRVPADKVILSLFTPYPGTEAFDLCRASGLIGPGYDPSLHYHQSPLNCFCSALTLERFRALVGEMEQAVVARNRQGLDRSL
ncbi:MAG: radical SAM protein [Proteobacteria bacterium]|nr:radical SAM protein [Pseudomonadota bacterium]